tara:strand:+ start:71 stop:694 length:624 start_codon:yes stop_codon:yes gene_type:complete
MSYIILGFLTGLSLIFAIGAQNIFVIEQGLKKEFVFLVCAICAFSDFLLIFLGIFIFHYFQNFFNPLLELILNFLLIAFLVYFIWSKIHIQIKKINFNLRKSRNSLSTVIFRTFSFTYINPHVYSDTVFFLGNFSKNFTFNEKLSFGIGATISSFIFFFFLGYMSKYLSKYLKTEKVWKIINLFIIIFMLFIVFYVLMNVVNFFKSY